MNYLKVPGYIHCFLSALPIGNDLLLEQSKEKFPLVTCAPFESERSDTKLIFVELFLQHLKTISRKKSVILVIRKEMFVGSTIKVFLSRRKTVCL